MDYKLASEKILAFAKTISWAEGELPDNVMPDRAVVMCLQIAWCDSVRDEWQHTLDQHPELKPIAEVAKQLMLEDRYDGDPICGVLGAKPMVAVVDGKETVSFEHSMGAAMPLSAIYANKVSAAMEISVRLAKAQDQYEKDNRPPTPTKGD